MSQKVKSELKFFSKSPTEPIYDRCLAERVILLADLKPKSLILDAGCGGGYWGRVFAGSGHRAVGIDLVPRVISRAAKKAVTGQSFLVGNLLKQLPFTKKNFDGIICGFILHHFPDKDDLDTVVNNLKNCLKQNGKIILVEPNGSNPIVSISRRIGRLLFHYYPQEIASENETVHSIEIYQNLLEENKMKILKIESYHHNDMVIEKKIKDRFINTLVMIRTLLLNIIWAISPEPYRGSEIIIIAQLKS